jgi:hypothetical protein
MNEWWYLVLVLCGEFLDECLVLYPNGRHRLLTLTLQQLYTDIHHKPATQWSRGAEYHAHTDIRAETKRGTREGVFTRIQHATELLYFMDVRPTFVRSCVCWVWSRSSCPLSSLSDRANSPRRRFNSCTHSSGIGQHTNIANSSGVRASRTSPTPQVYRSRQVQVVW